MVSCRSKNTMAIASATISGIPKAERRAAGVSPPLKWAGGKRWQLPYVARHWIPHTHRRLVEPFCGGLAIALGLMPERALLNDINPHLINLYCWLKRGLVNTISFENEESAFYAARARFNALLKCDRANGSEMAALFYYLNRTGYNGLCRFNRRGELNVPFGRYVNIGYRCDFSAYRQAFARWQFTAEHFLNVRLQNGDFVYADPPYRCRFHEILERAIHMGGPSATAEWLARHKGPVILSNQATKRILELSSDLRFEVLLLTAPRRISCTGDRSPALEVLAVRNLSQPPCQI